MKIRTTCVSLLIAGSLLSTPALAGDNEGEERQPLRMDEVVAQAETTPEARQAEERGQAGPQTDPLDPTPARMRALQLGGDQSVTSGTQFNPAISVILDGVYYNEISGHVEDPPGFDGGGHSHGHGHGVEQGFQIREAEMAFTGSVDPYFDMFVMAAFFEEGVELEEAYITSRSLPAGLQLKAGRFLSDVGYINKQHIHDWDFVDAPWAIDELFGEEGLRENGLQLTWMPATRSYMRFGVELLQGESEGVANYLGDGRHEMVTVLPAHVNDPDLEPGDPGANAPDRNRWRADKGLQESSAPRLSTVFAKWAPNLGYAHALQLGVFAGASDVFQREETHSSGRLETWDGDSDFHGFDVVYKYNGQGVHGHRNFQLQAEYIRRNLDLLYQSRQFSDFGTLEPTTRGGTPDVVDQRWAQDGFYIQGVYGFAPRWNAGLRVDALGLTNDAYADQDAGRGLPTEYETSYRYALQLTYAPTEFSRFRAQLNNSHYGHEHGHGHGHDDEEDAWEFMLQYNISLGVHGAHTF